MKKIPLLILALGLLLIGMPVQAEAADSPVFRVDGRLFATPAGEPVPYVNADGRTMGSIRLIGAVLGVESRQLKWDKASQTVTIEKGDTTVKVTVGSNEMLINGSPVTMDTQAEIVHNRVFIPARYIGEAFGIRVTYDAKTRTVGFLTGAEVEASGTAVYYHEAKLRGILLGDAVETLTSRLGQPDRLFDHGELRYYTYNADYSGYALYIVHEGRVAGMYSGAPQVWESSTLAAIGSPESTEDRLGDVYIRYYLDEHADRTVEAIMLAIDSRYVPKSAATREQGIETAMQVFDMTNVFRLKQGLAPFLWHEQLAETAYKHSKDMSDRDYFDHKNPDGLSPFDRMKADGLNYWAAAENIAWGYSNAPHVTNGWINSYGHRMNMLSESVESLGVGVYERYYTQNFITER